MAVADLKKRLDAAEKLLQATSQLALATDRDCRQERSRHELIVHLRGEAVEQVQKIFEEHILAKDNKDGQQTAKKTRNSAGGADAATAALADTAARNLAAAATLRVKIWLWLQQELKARATAAEEAGRAQLAVQAVGKIHAMDGQMVLHSCRFHSKEPLEGTEPLDRVWHFSLDFAYTGDGALAMQLFSYDLQPFSYSDLTFHKATSRPGTLAKRVSALSQR